MPAIPTLKTYGRNNGCGTKFISKHSAFPISKASNVFDALFAKNIEKRETPPENTKPVATRSRRKPLCFKELPPPGPSQLSNSDSFNFKANTTFDKLLEGSNYNNVQFCNVSAIQIDSSLENSKESSNERSSGYNTRKKIRKNYAKINSYGDTSLKKDSRGKLNKSKIIEKKKLNLLINQVLDESVVHKVPDTQNNISNSYDSIVEHKLIIEKDPKTNCNYSYRRIFLNSSTACARKFTPIASTSRLCSRNTSVNDNNCSNLFQNGFRHCMRAESTPKYVLSSTPIVTRTVQKNNEMLDVSPISARTKNSLLCNSRLVSLFEKNSDCEIINSVKTSKKLSLRSTSKNSINIVSSIDHENDSTEPLTPSLRISDDSKINYNSLLKENSSTAYTKRKVRSASDGVSINSINIAKDIKLNAIPIVVIERNLDVLGISGKVSLVYASNLLDKNAVSDCKQSETNNDISGKSKTSPRAGLQKLSTSTWKKRTKNSNSRSHIFKRSRNSDFEINAEMIKRNLFNNTELKRSKSDSSIICNEKYSEIHETKMQVESIIDLVSDSSSDVIEASQQESVRNPLNFVTKRKNDKFNISFNDAITNESRDRFDISLHEWERFSQSNICLVKIDPVSQYSVHLEHSPSRTKDKSSLNNKPICIDDQSIAVSPINTKTIISNLDDSRHIDDILKGRQSFVLKPGKQWFRSLSILRKTIYDIDLSESCSKGRKWRDSVIQLIQDQECSNSVINTSLNENNISNIENKIQLKIRPSARRKTLKIVPLSVQSTSKCIQSDPNSINNSGYVSSFANESILESFDKLSLTADVGDREETAKQIILKRCGQTTPLPFNDCYSQRILKKCRKIGEGVYGEVFMYKSLDNKCKVIKIIPIEGDLVVNGEHQKKFEEIISEIIIASELSNLRTNNEFCTDGFNELLKICCVQGKYPKHLLDLWNLYDEDTGSENDSPAIFTDDQLYMVLELANGGQDLEAYRFNNAEQSFSLFVQVVSTLAVAEAALQFEHRDMHWGNILISPTDDATNTFRHNGREFEVATRGVKVSIIDFTLSRMTYNNCCIFNDLALDPDLFTATGDYQFEIYRLMRKRNQDDWQSFEPYSNILWLDYTLDKMIHQLRYLRVNTKTHKTYLRRLSQLKKKVLIYNSATEFLNSDVLSHVFL